MQLTQKDIIFVTPVIVTVTVTITMNPIFVETILPDNEIVRNASVGHMFIDLFSDLFSKIERLRDDCFKLDGIDESTNMHNKYQTYTVSMDRLNDDSFTDTYMYSIPINPDTYLVLKIEKIHRKGEYSFTVLFEIYNSASRILRANGFNYSDDFVKICSHIEKHCREFCVKLQ